MTMFIVLSLVFLVLGIVSFIGGFITALYFAKYVFGYYKAANNIKEDTFPFLSVFKDKGLSKDEQERRLKHAKTEWEKKVKDITREHI